jgi:thioredoxin reductase (NADPH)
LRAEKVLQDRLFKHEKVEVIWNHTVDEILGDESPLNVTGVRLKNELTGAMIEKPTHGVFIAIGHKPNTAIFKGKLDMDEEGYLKVKAGTCETNIKGVYAAGDVQDKKYRQAITAAGMGCMAALDAEKLLAESH